MLAGVRRYWQDWGGGGILLNWSVSADLHSDWGVESPNPQLQAHSLGLLVLEAIHSLKPPPSLLRPVSKLQINRLRFLVQLHTKHWFQNPQFWCFCELFFVFIIKIITIVLGVMVFQYLRLCSVYFRIKVWRIGKDSNGMSCGLIDFLSRELPGGTE